MNDDKRPTENILLIDDKLENLRVLDRLLTETGYKVRPASNGRLAISSALKKIPDLVLLDIRMPGMNGYEVCEQLKADERTRHVPVVFISAMDETIDKVRAFSAGGVDYITKPFQEEEVLARVETHLKLRYLQRQLEEQNKYLSEAARLREDVERITRHDLKTPLNTMISFTRLMMATENLPAEHLEYLKVIEASGMMMTNMISLSLDMFRMERKAYHLHPAPVDVLQAIRRIVNDRGSKTMPVTIRINGSPEGEEEGFPVWGEEMLCYSMLANLIKNAFEASPEGEQIMIELADEKDISVISIHNQGAVSGDIRDRFFEKYATSGKEFGTGLGTYSAKLIAETQRGSIHLETSEEKGTRVTVRLPSCSPEDRRRYADDIAPEPENDASGGKTALGPSSLAALPSELIDDLEKAVTVCNMSEISSVVRRIQDRDESLADELTQLADNFEYAEILSAVIQMRQGKK